MDAHALTDFKQTNVSTAEKRLQEAMMKLKTKLETKEGDNANSGDWLRCDKNSQPNGGWEKVIR